MRATLFSLSIMALFTATTAQAQTLASVNGSAITEDMLFEQMQNVPANLIKERGPEVRAKLLQQLIDQELLVQEAKRVKVEEDADFKNEEKKLHRALMYTYMLERQVRDNVTDELIKSTYEKMAADAAEPMVRARHILVKTKEEALALIKTLNGGADFATLAKENSTGPSKTQGGDLGWFRRGDMVKPFADVAFNLLPNAYSKDPVQTQFGWHIVKVEERKEDQKPSFKELEPKIQKKLTQTAVTAFLEGLKNKATIIYADDLEE